jgi:hypothetical protein
MSAPYGKPLSDLAMAKRDQKVVALKRQDMSFQQVADTLGISKAAAIRSFQRAKRRVDDATDLDYTHYRDEQLARIAAMREVAADIVGARHVAISNGHVVSEITGTDEDGHPVYGDPYEDDGPVLAAIDRLIKLDELEAKLVPGLHAKQEVDMSGVLRIELVGVDVADLT